jgi:WS/DGAT/MGAT family acyltransferase
MGQAVRKLSSIDAAFLYLETPEMPMHVGSIAVFRLPKDYKGNFFEDFKAMIASRLDLAPILKSKLAKTPLDIDHPSWVVDEQFDIDRHIFRGSLPAPADYPTLERIVGWMHAKLLDRSRPLWEFYLFEGLPDGQVALYAKLHHACVDGGAAAALTEIVYDATPEPRVIREIKSTEAARVEPRNFAVSFLDSYLKLWTQPVGSSTALGSLELPRIGNSDLGSVLFDNAMQQIESTMRFMSGLPTIAKTVSDIVSKTTDPRSREGLSGMISPATPLNKSISSERSYAAASISLPRAKAVAKAAGGKLNDVVLAISSGVLRRYLLEHGGLPNRSMTAAVPISVREQGNADANNQVFGMVCSLASDLEDPKERLLTIMGEATKAKELSSPLRPLVPHLAGFAPLGSPIVVQILSLLYSRSNLSDVLPPPANVTISNVPGSRQPLYALGAELLHFFPVSLVAHGLALNMSVHSYCDQLDFGLIAGANVIPNLHGMAHAIPVELELLERAFGLEVGAPATPPVSHSTADERPAV